MPGPPLAVFKGGVVYYPFGLTFNSYQRENSVAQDYKYNGKEEQTELGLGWLDYGARMLDPALGRWFVVDNLADHTNQISWTPYHYVKNNPTNSTDPDGNCGDCFLDLAFILYDVGEIAYDFVTTGKVDPVSVAALSADAIALATPAVTGAGIVVRLGKEGGEAVAKQIAKEGAEKVVKETGEKAAKETGEKASKQEARFVADTDGKIIDTNQHQKEVITNLMAQEPTFFKISLISTKSKTKITERVTHMKLTLTRTLELGKQGQEQIEIILTFLPMKK
jgi:RHS repeat-associated protein